MKNQPGAIVVPVQARTSWYVVQVFIAPLSSYLNITV